MVYYDYGQLQSIWLQASQGTKYHTGPWAALMAAIALAESSGNPDATNPTDNGGTQTSWGLWQISLGNHQAPAANWNNPIVNAQLAIGKLNSQGLGAWGTYNSGAYKKYMQGTPPQNVNVGSPGAPGTPGNPIQAQTTAFGPLGWIWGQEIKGIEWAGKLIVGTTGIGATIGDVATAITGLVRGITKITQIFLMLFRPEFWLRVGAFLFGLLSLGAALYFFKEAI